jgi:hypothetical protein
LLKTPALITLSVHGALMCWGARGTRSSASRKLDGDKKT